jgi:hypothetical protein
MNAAAEEVVRDISGLEAGGSMVSLLNRSEIDQQIATAHRFPRSIKRFRDEATQMVTLSESVAGQCIYALPRDGKTIEGPSARFAEVVASAWGNSRAGARVVDERGDFIVAQGVFHDLERNVAITYEVQRRVVDKNGRRFKTDMIGVTANAACSIALRNAILKGVPKAFWEDMYNEARKVIMGDIKTLGNRRADAVAAFQRYGVSVEQLCAKLEVAGVEDISLEHLVTLRGLLTAIKEGDTTAEDAFGATPQPVKELKPYTTEDFDKNLPKWRTAIESGKKSADDIIAMASTRGVLSDAQKSAIKGEPTKEAGAVEKEAEPPAPEQQADAGEGEWVDPFADANKEPQA